MSEDRIREILKTLEHLYTTEELYHIWMQLSFSHYQKQFKELLK